MACGQTTVNIDYGEPLVCGHVTWQESCVSTPAVMCQKPARWNHHTPSAADG